ncbi:hypothetical protein EST38_g14255 [Candolleomyces aberdarensis]|uniref:F-box domain-containing protein n=1 Tax=Candolleomyces aberdarensis TaxID=2316362 RepID=A0A4Q2CXR7_9AGAR|nr:hypothetical protein EST38_g14255 [Candolleomyces aberdarensis]
MVQTTRLNARALCEEVDQRVAQPKIHQNTVAATSPLPPELPPEILSNIFIVLRRIVADGNHYESDVSWTRVTHVCRHGYGHEQQQLSAQFDILDLRIVGHYESRIKCWFGENKLPTRFDDDDPPANLAVSSKSSHGVISTPLLKTITDHLDISSLHSLKISSHDILEEDALTLFKNMTKLDTITICGNYETLSKFLDEFQKQGSDTISPSFPALRSVHLHKIDFEESRTGEADDAVRAIITALEDRKASHPIEQLTISKCINFSKAHWKDLRASSIFEYVEMDWDEDEDIREDEDSDYDYDYNFDFDYDNDYDYEFDSGFNPTYDYDYDNDNDDDD